MSILRELWRGKDLYRILMNRACARHDMKGVTFDIGAGAAVASYRRFLRTAPGATIQSFDLAIPGASGGQGVNLEIDTIPASDGGVDTVLLFNILEHLGDCRHILSEIHRILAPGGQVLGAVPFLIGYHPDPHDYWRFTRESLARIFTAANLSIVEIRTLATGPFGAAWAQIEWLCPRILKCIFLPIVLCLDWIVRRVRPRLSPDRFALGFFFILKR